MQTSWRRSLRRLCTLLNSENARIRYRVSRGDGTETPQTTEWSPVESEIYPKIAELVVLRTGPHPEGIDHLATVLDAGVARI
jgi:hypothetical protein